MRVAAAAAAGAAQLARGSPVAVSLRAAAAASPPAVSACGDPPSILSVSTGEDADVLETKENAGEQLAAALAAEEHQKTPPRRRYYCCPRSF